MGKFIKKQIVVEAVQLNRKFFNVVLHFIDGNVICGFNNGEFPEDDCYINIKTLEGTMTAVEGDWIIKGVKGEFYPCKPDIFAETYDSIKPDVGAAQTEKSLIYTTALEFYVWLQLRTEAKGLKKFAPYQRFSQLFIGEKGLTI